MLVYREKNVVSYLRDSYIKYPLKIACSDENDSITYKELWEASHTIAGNLLKITNKNTPIPILMKKSCVAMKALWGIIKAGACYVIIDPMLPKERIRQILENLSVKWVIGEESSIAKVPEGTKVCSISTLMLRSEGDEIVDKQIGQICDIDPLYIMFTSGSTGIPKGIVANHRSVMDFIDYFIEIFHIRANDIIANQAPWDFDVSIKDIFSSVRVGAELQIIPKKYFSLPVQLVEFLEKKKVTTLIWAVSALCIISTRGILDHIRPSGIQKIIFSGEVMPIRQYNIWRKHYPQAMIANVYGPTEITCNCTYFFVHGFYDEEEEIPIGEAFPNERVFLLDEDEKLIEKEETEHRIGEICVSGTAVTAGYYNNAKESEKSFVQNPLNKSYREIIYKTGDMGYYNKDKQLCFASRKDYQIKHMGHRIELSEIEKAISSIPGTGLSCCIYQNSEIYAFIEGKIEERRIVMALKKKLPVYMVPAKILNVDTIPLNKNGKIDRKKLKEWLVEAC